jgi:hypothetical protein
MKQTKGRDYKSTRQWTDEDRQAKKRLKKSINAAYARGELDEDKFVPQQTNNGSKGERK